VIVVSDSGPLIHLASIRQFSLLKRFFHTLHRVPQVYEEVSRKAKDVPATLKCAKLCKTDGYW
jgi:predicted nucleic acid-binding protein